MSLFICPLRTIKFRSMRLCPLSLPVGVRVACQLPFLMCICSPNLVRSPIPFPPPPNSVRNMPVPPPFPVSAPAAMPPVPPDLPSMTVAEVDWFFTAEQEMSSDQLKFKVRGCWVCRNSGDSSIRANKTPATVPECGDPRAVLQEHTRVLD